MTLSATDLLKAIFSRDARKGLSISHMGGTLEPGGFVTGSGAAQQSHRAYTGELMDAQTRNELVYACLAVKIAATRSRLIVERAKTARQQDGITRMPGRSARAHDAAKSADDGKRSDAGCDRQLGRIRPASLLRRELHARVAHGSAPAEPALRMAPLLNRAPEQIGWEWNDGGIVAVRAPEEVIVRTAPASV